LSAIAPCITEEGGKAVVKSMFNGKKLPVWFGEREGREAGTKVKHICYLDADLKVTRWCPSPAEDSYENAAKAFKKAEMERKKVEAVLTNTSETQGQTTTTGISCDNEMPDDDSQGTFGKQSDFGLIMRLSSKNKGDRRESQDENEVERTIILAGIHQFGTLLAGEFFSRACQGRYEKQAEAIFGEDDFAIVVYGTFDTRTFHVLDCRIFDMWQHSEGEWIQIFGAGTQISQGRLPRVNDLLTASIG